MKVVVVVFIFFYNFSFLFKKKSNETIESKMMKPQPLSFSIQISSAYLKAIAISNILIILTNELKED